MLTSLSNLSGAFPKQTNKYQFTGYLYVKNVSESTIRLILIISMLLYLNYLHNLTNAVFYYKNLGIFTMQSFAINYFVKLSIYNYILQILYSQNSPSTELMELHNIFVCFFVRGAGESHSLNALREWSELWRAFFINIFFIFPFQRECLHLHHLSSFFLQYIV